MNTSAMKPGTIVVVTVITAAIYLALLLYGAFRSERRRTLERYRIAFAHCPKCKAMQPVRQSFTGFYHRGDSRYFGTDLVCGTCTFVIAVLYDPAS